jgi:hypothetical protein
MIAFQMACPKGHKYMSKIDPKCWALSHLTFNCLGNLTSNDAEGTFGLAVKPKNAGNVYDTWVLLWEKSSKKMFTLWEAYLLSNGTFASPTLESEYLALLQEAVQTDSTSQATHPSN